MEKAFLKQGLFRCRSDRPTVIRSMEKLNCLEDLSRCCKWQRDHAVTVESAARIKPEEMEDKFLIGVLADRELPVYRSNTSESGSAQAGQGNDA